MQRSMNTTTARLSNFGAACGPSALTSSDEAMTRVGATNGNKTSAFQVMCKAMNPNLGQSAKCMSKFINEN